MKMDQQAMLQSTTISKSKTEWFAPAPRLAIFAYGTLKSGQRNHDYFCGDAVDIRPATTFGRLHVLPTGYPALVVPEPHVLAHGTADPFSDAATQVRIAGDLADMTALSRPDGDWDLVHGEVITFTDPLCSLPPIDRLEGFHPGGPSLYWRVLLPVQEMAHPAVPGPISWPGALVDAGCGKASGPESPQG